MIQCVVAHMYRGKLVLKEALCKTVYHAFNSLEGVKLINIAKQQEYVLDLIVFGKGSNNLVELCHGLTASLADLPNLEFNDDDQNTSRNNTSSNDTSSNDKSTKTQVVIQVVI